MKQKDAFKLFSCPHCLKKHFKKKGYYYRRITKTYVPRYYCFSCKKHFSTRTLSKTYKQKRPDLNQKVFDYLTSGVSLRRTSQKLKCNYLTVYRKFIWLSQLAKSTHLKQQFYIQELQFDEMESIEHTKLKPLAIAIATSEDYQILGVQVGTLPAKGKLSELSRKKYGHRENQSDEIVENLLKNLDNNLANKNFIIKSDAKPSYKRIVNKVYPNNEHKVYVSRENKEKKRDLKYTNLEKRVFDPIFSVNQRMAKFRDHIKRLTRRSWCTTKIKENLEKHIYLYIADNNNYILI